MKKRPKIRNSARLRSAAAHVVAADTAALEDLDEVLNYNSAAALRALTGNTAADVREREQDTCAHAPCCGFCR